MPGIAGIVSPGASDQCQQMLTLMLRSMNHKWDYVSGAYSFPSAGVYAGWIAHAGSFSARQCEQRARSGAVVLFAGESFHADTGKGTSPQNAASAEDVDGLLDLYAAEGAGFVTRLNGMFSGLLIDSAASRALLFNDRYGMERIYYYEKNGTTFFASEAKALLSVLPELRSLDEGGVAEFLAYGSTLRGQTLFRNIKLLPGGSLWTLDRSRPTVKERYFAPEQWEIQSELSAEEFDSEFQSIFRRVLPSYLSSQTRLGISLTGGLDTRMIMACIEHTGRKAVCYTYGGLTGETLDARIASRVAHECGFDHHNLRIGSDFLKNYSEYVDRTVFLTDGCATALGAHEVYFTALARELSPIRLTGNFGSEVFRNVSTFKPVRFSSRLLIKDFREVVDARIVEVSSEQVHPVTHAAFREIPWHLFGTLAAARSEITFRTPYLDNDLVKLAFRAPHKHRQTARSALKFINDCSPMLGKIPTDHGLVWNGSKTANTLRNLFCKITFKLDYMHHDGLPNGLASLDGVIGSFSKFGILNLHKFLPYREWFKTDLAGCVRDRIAAMSRQGLPYWDRNVLETIATDHIHGRRNNIREINAILTLEAVTRLLLRSPSTSGDILAESLVK